MQISITRIKIRQKPNSKKSSRLTSKLCINANTVLLVPMEMVTEALPAVTMEIILMAATVTLEDLTSADLTLEDSETFAVTPVSISRDDPARPVTKVTFICRPLPISLIMAAIRKQSMF